jgi:nicotinamidase/pyrazinamidase
MCRGGARCGSVSSGELAGPCVAVESGRSGDLRYSRPMPTYDRRTALVIIDVQNDFADPAGSLSVKGAAAIVPRVTAEAWAAIRSGAFVAYTQDWHPPSTPHFQKDGGIWPVHCVQDTWGAEFHPALDVLGPWVRKGSNGEDGYSGFTMRDAVTGTEVPTELEALLRVRGIENVVIAGLATDYCINATGLDAIRLGFKTEVLEDAIAAVDLRAGDAERAIAELHAAGCEFSISAVGRRGAGAERDATAAGRS